MALLTSNTSHLHLQALVIACGTEILTQSLQGTSNAWTAEPHRATETLGPTMTWH